MKYFLGYQLSNEVCDQLEDISKKASKIFEGQDIPVRWNERGQYRISLHEYERLNFLQKILIKKKLQKLETKSLTISFHMVKLGVSKRMKDLVYISIDQGGEDIRDLKERIVKELGIKNTSLFVPHIIIGRVSKDVTKQESSNIIKDLENLQKQVKGIRFTIKDFNLFENYLNT
jgi:2'-5' RNA ligase